jgi:hypothetical protein
LGSSLFLDPIPNGIVARFVGSMIMSPEPLLTTKNDMKKRNNPLTYFYKLLPGNNIKLAYSLRLSIINNQKLGIVS